MNPSSKIIIFIITLSLALYLPIATAIGHNGRIDMLHTVSHKDEIDSLLRKRYTGDAAPSGGEIHRVKEVVHDKSNLKSNADANVSRKTLLMAAKNGK